MAIDTAAMAWTCELRRRCDYQRDCGYQRGVPALYWTCAINNPKGFLYAMVFSLGAQGARRGPDGPQSFTCQVCVVSLRDVWIPIQFISASSQRHSRSARSRATPAPGPRTRSLAESAPVRQRTTPGISELLRGDVRGLTKWVYTFDAEV